MLPASEDARDVARDDATEWGITGPRRSPLTPLCTLRARMYCSRHTPNTTAAIVVTMPPTTATTITAEDDEDSGDGDGGADEPELEFAVGAGVGGVGVVVVDSHASVLHARDTGVSIHAAPLPDAGLVSTNARVCEPVPHVTEHGPYAANEPVQSLSTIHTGRLHRRSRVAESAAQLPPSVAGCVRITVRVCKPKPHVTEHDE
jgi:hypothetical protein